MTQGLVLWNFCTAYMVPVWSIVVLSSLPLGCVGQQCSWGPFPLSFYPAPLSPREPLGFKVVHAFLDTLFP